ncbi:hypothetical protein B566_EDAN016439 [Ephemera danica]|nr:hypothetical protein B566_EDAN016439 [Ephemera danica]
MKICLLLLTVAATALAGRIPTERAAPLDRYLSLAEANAWIDGILTAYPSVATAQSLGTSSEGRSAPSRSQVAAAASPSSTWTRWISLPATLNLISELTENGNAMLATADFYIVPIVNPDGYEYAFTTDSSWRKNRQSNPGSTCIGVDPNRNFDVHFNEGGNNDPCSTDFPGTSATSTAETIAVTSFLNANPVSAFISVHSFGSVTLEQGVNPFHLTMPHELCERYLDDLTEELPYVKNVDGSYTWKYTALQVFATKP